jgi:hypothetical protein
LNTEERRLGARLLLMQAASVLSWFVTSVQR